ncbi:glycoside hydrolase family 18 protein [Parathielavia appendiculata]|uniref:chitinase n=1 Tax=Parathielavia appendiculata TaxID=2587402 RepID=A0AAN6YZ60_9PEZI|nr:glycoside hydrolase family 18 protein [Parathielavia appendiculata]
MFTPNLLHWLCLSFLYLAFGKADDDLPLTAISPVRRGLLASRQELPEGTCTSEIPCANKACCNGITGICGFDPVEHCGATCTSKCDSKAECGKYADPPGKLCPINVCCSKHGFCGTTDEFCSDGCQSKCEQPGSTSPHTTDVRELVIGYVEGWAFTRRGCSQRTLDAIRIDSLTHLFVSFGYITPDTYEIYPMRGVTEENLLALTGLKERAPGLKVWIALGGWSFSDNHTETQPVWGDLASTPVKRERFLDQLEKFMIHYGFDGVDYDWEYPGAGDRGGHPEDGPNFVSLLEDTRSRFRALARGWGISFTAPSSYWYMQHFRIGEMMEHVDFVNLMTYDLFGSWDKDSDWIGPYVYGHTNLTVIKQALNLLWRNGVPANQVNLGLGFYGRTYVLKDPHCDRPGCEFTDPGRAGQCSGQGGYMSYQDIAWVRKESGAIVTTDRENAIKYFRYDDNQWVSFDDEETLRWKVEFANEQGLRGLFIWAVTQDTANNDLLDAVLQPDGLGKFRDRNGVHSGIDDWDTRVLDRCVFSDCNGDCYPGYLEVAHIRCDAEGSVHPRKKLCCPFGSAPNPNDCRWRSDKWGFWCGVPGTGSIFNKCEDGEQRVISDHWFIDDQGRDDVCSTGTNADYCCATERDAVCEWSGKCARNGAPSPCKSGMTAYMKDNLGIRWASHCDPYAGEWEVLCCEDGVEPDCRWLGDPNNRCAGECAPDEVNFGRHHFGGGEQCYDSRAVNDRNFYQFEEDMPDYQNGRVMCCKRDSVRVKTKPLPVPLENLFDEEIGADEEQSFDIDVDLNRKTGESSHPNDNSFGWHIMSGPPDQLQNLNKRDGSHWEVYGCDAELHEGRQSARLVCTRDRNSEHNCDDILLGGVEDTVLEMPPHCGPGKYALAVSLEPMHDASTDNILSPRLKRRLPVGATVYNLTFDYGFHRLRGRQDNRVKLRIDYSNARHYWNQIVAASPNEKRSMEDLEHIVKRDHDGDWKRYLDHSYRMDRRNTPPEELHLLHERWYSANLIDWIAKMRNVQMNVDVLDQRVRKSFIYTILHERRDCMLNDFTQLILEADIHARITADVQTSGVLTLIGDLNDMSSFRHSYVNFRNKGEIKASLVFAAHGELRIPYMEETLLGIAPIGASFKIPGIVTIGPEFKLVASVEGKVVIDADARVDFEVASWDYSQRYPAENDEFLDPEKDDPDHPKFSTSNEGGGPVEFNWQVTAEGVVELHLIPMLTFGVVFDPKWEVPRTAVDLAVDTYLRIHGYAAVGSQQDFEYCIGAEAGYDTFAQVTAPTLFGVNLNRRWSLFSDERSIYQSPSCPSESLRRGLLLDGPSAVNTATPVVKLVEAKPGFTPLETFSLHSSF